MTKPFKSQPRTSGLSLLEVMVSLAIMGVLALIIAGAVSNHYAQLARARSHREVTDIFSLIDAIISRHLATMNDGCNSQCPPLGPCPVANWNDLWTVGGMNLGGGPRARFVWAPGGLSLPAIPAGIGAPASHVTAAGQCNPWVDANLGRHKFCLVFKPNTAGAARGGSLFGNTHYSFARISYDLVDMRNHQPLSCAQFKNNTTQGANGLGVAVTAVSAFAGLRSTKSSEPIFIRKNHISYLSVTRPVPP